MNDSVKVTNDSFSMVIEDQFRITNRGIVVTGILQGTICLGMPVLIKLKQCEIRTIVHGIEHYRKLYEKLSSPYNDFTCGIGVLLPLENIVAEKCLIGYTLSSR